MTGGRCSLLVRVPSPLTINMTLHSLVGAGVSSDRDRDRDERRSPAAHAGCPLELVIEDGSRRHTSPLCPLRQHRQRNVYQSHDSQIRLYFTHRDARHHHVQLPQHSTGLQHHRHITQTADLITQRAAFIVRVEGK